MFLDWLSWDWKPVYVNYSRQPEKSMNVAYTKMHGTGNQILVVDQLMWIGPADGDDVVASYRVFNADGSDRDTRPENRKP